MSLAELFHLSQELITLTNHTFKRYLFHTHPFASRLSILIGQRGVGKTTTLIQYLMEYAKNDVFCPTILYCPVDHFKVKDNTLYDIAENFFLTGGECLVFDEIHKYENWSLELKSIYDSFPKLKIIASGSSALEIHKGSRDLSRRSIVYHLHGMSFREFLALKNQMLLPSYSLEKILSDHQSIAKEILLRFEQHQKKVLREFSDYLLFGFYPYFFEFNNLSLFQTTLEQNIHTTIESDLLSIYPALTGKSIQKLKQLLKFIAKSVPFTPNWREIQSILEIGDQRTLKAYFKYLDDAGLIKMVESTQDKLAKLNLIGKIYLNNPNLMVAIAKENSNIGSLRELFFINMITVDHEIALQKKGDFVIDHHKIVEVGGKNKDHLQIKNLAHAYLAIDQIEMGFKNKIPLWLFGFLY